ncbi:unnamed protein product [Parascedosporium putredinis]|uniref:Uncharacterized protein n=1 Tax=Parascedosporium putredinis TaxID=1442378 RepID=A0A9P1GUP9_9PEZI|nr:unnamed protein product [Parascedosporium putredinis]CAI7987681.1 unnamed protein product [Parascedosporium putredinis]
MGYYRPTEPPPKETLANRILTRRQAHLRCDAQRPCSRCLMNGKEDSCIDVQHKKRGRPRLRDDRDARFEGSRYIERALASDANVYPAPPLSITTRPPEPVAYLTMEWELVKASATFLELVGLQAPSGRSLFDVVLPVERERIAGYKTALQEDRSRQEPRYLPPIFNKQESERVIQTLGFGAEDISRVQLERHGLLTFLSTDGQRSMPFQFGLTKVESIYVVPRSRAKCSCVFTISQPPRVRGEWIVVVPNSAE